MKEWREWQTAFLRQARSDWEAYQRTFEKKWPACYRLLFLQMSTEKLGKALLVSSEMKFEEITRSHAAFVKFMRIISNNRSIHAKLGMTRTQLRTNQKTLAGRL